ncbi:g10353 [Coccomyxa viridis]|uniref:G10353 protein n=1 Tax=Coccomyxa viridis TaxID=1274662 RepID=A0ABP1GC74_9CHLO
MRESPGRSSFSRIGPDRQTVPEPLGKRQLVIRKFAPSYARPPSRAAESAAAVACFGSSPPSDRLLGTSPVGSFEHEMLRFMQSNVAGSRQGRRRSRGSPSPGGAQGRAVEVLHLERVVRPLKSKRHPMAGLWKADYGLGGVQIILINYDFSGPAARIVAIKVTGDDHVPAGKHTWHAAAAPLKRPWATAEAALVDMQGQLLLQQAAGDLDEAMESHKNVVGIYEGKGSIAALAYNQARWVEGRLWEYSDGSCGFVWLDTMFDFVLVQLERIETDLRPAC